MGRGTWLTAGRRIGAATIAVACVVLLSSCQLVNAAVSSPHKYPEDIGHLSGDRMDQIVDLLVRHDAKGVKALFSPKARAEADDLDAEIHDLFTVFTGKLDWADGNNFYPSEFKDSGPDGEYWKYFAPFCADFADGRQYEIYFIDYVENTVDPDLVGLYSLRAENAPGVCMFEADQSAYDRIDATTSDPSHEVPGIVVDGGGSP